MKKNIIILLLLILCIQISTGDVIPGGHHVVSRSVTISNCDEYPDYTLVGYITGPMIVDYELLIVEQDVHLNKGYKFNELKLYAIRSDVINAMGSVENIDFGYLTRVAAPIEIIDTAPTYVVDANTLISEAIVYTIWGVSEGELIIYISERRLEYDDGSPPTIRRFTYTP